MKPKTGILIINLGTPESPSVQSVHRYLKEFLSDSRVIERSGILWWFVLNRIILPRRAKSSAHAYSLIWDKDRNESPLKTITRSQAEKLALSFSDNPEVMIDWAMRYGKPSIDAAIARLSDAGCSRILLFPLYPQYSGATTASAMDGVFASLGKMRAQPAIRTVPPYYANAGYVEALADSIRAHLTSLPWEPEMVLASFHGLPEAFIRKGDPYQDQCEKTAKLLREALGMNGEVMPLVYQSRGGKAVWIGPQLDDTLVKLAQKGVRDICVVTPGFASDCIETLEEVQMRAAETFKEHGGQNLSLVPCLNDSEGSIRMLRDLANSQLGGWV